MKFFTLYEHFDVRFDAKNDKEAAEVGQAINEALKAMVAAIPNSEVLYRCTDVHRGTANKRIFHEEHDSEALQDG